MHHPAPDSLPPPRGAYRTYDLPHLDFGPHPQFVTFRLFGTLPSSLVESWRGEFARLPEDRRHAAMRRRCEEWLDRGDGDRLLADPSHAAVVRDALLHFDGERYDLHAWAVMPNHVHVLFTPRPGHAIGKIVGSWKGFSAYEINARTGRRGPVWQRDFFDRYVRDQRHFAAVRTYVEENPVKAGVRLGGEPWPFVSRMPGREGRT
jgi:REP element-mobilizing transposase RayT